MPATTKLPAAEDFVIPGIADLDADLSLATRTMKAAPAKERPEWKRLIDGLLDRRLELMRRANP